MFRAVKTFKAAHQSSLHVFSLKMYKNAIKGGRWGVGPCLPIHNMNSLYSL